jgi:hypothetical protein
MVDNFSGPRAYRPTEPYDPSDPPKFGQLIETTKDGIASELRRFFDYQSEDMRAKLGELPTIEKFAHGGAGSTQQSMETVVNLIMSHADAPDRFPMVAITSASVREKRLGLGGNLASSGQYPPAVTGTEMGPFDLTPEWTVQLETDPHGTGVLVTSTILFAEILFSDIHNASAQDVADAINMQALFFHAVVVGGGFIRLVTGGPAAPGVPNSIEITGGTPACLAALGFEVGQSDVYTNPTNPPKKRYEVAADMTINIDVVADSINVRGELADLVFDFFAVYLERQYFQMFGRSYFDRDLDPPEWFQLILQGQFAWSGEYAQPRAGGDQREQIYSIRGSVPLIAVDFVNRDVQRGSQTWLQPEDAQQTEELPGGDYDVVHSGEFESG